jgi:hypothetical protein
VVQVPQRPPPPTSSGAVIHLPVEAAAPTPSWQRWRSPLHLPLWIHHKALPLCHRWRWPLGGNAATGGDRGRWPLASGGQIWWQRPSSVNHNGATTMAAPPLPATMGASIFGMRRERTLIWVPSLLLCKIAASFAYSIGLHFFPVHNAFWVWVVIWLGCWRRS